MEDKIIQKIANNLCHPSFGRNEADRVDISQFTNTLLTNEKFEKGLALLGDIPTEDLTLIVHKCYLCAKLPPGTRTRGKLEAQIEALERLNNDYGGYIFQDIATRSRFLKVIEWYKEEAESAEPSPFGKPKLTFNTKQLLLNYLDKKLTKLFPRTKRKTIYGAISCIMQSVYPGEFLTAETVRVQLASRKSSIS